MKQVPSFPGPEREPQILSMRSESTSLEKRASIATQGHLVSGPFTHFFFFFSLGSSSEIVTIFGKSTLERSRKEKSGDEMESIGGTRHICIIKSWPLYSSASNTSWIFASVRIKSKFFDTAQRPPCYDIYAPSARQVIPLLLVVETLHYSLSRPTPPPLTLILPLVVASA